MGGEVLLIIPLSCIWAGGGRVSTHLGRAKGLAAVEYSTLATVSGVTVIDKSFLALKKKKLLIIYVVQRK
ncbi:hypothetical protein Hanom_Chr00s000075g01618981 [Helianthus anomalus]